MRSGQIPAFKECLADCPAALTLGILELHSSGQQSCTGLGILGAARWCVWAGRGDMGPDMELPSHSKQLLLQLNQQRTKGFLCDVIIMVENSIFRAHKNVLAASSIYFKSLVLHDNLINLDTDMVSSTVFQQILDFIYTGKLLPSDQPAEPNFSTLLTAASYLQLPELAALCRRKLKRAGKPFGSGRGGAGLGRPPRSQRLSAASVIQARYPGLVDGRKRGFELAGVAAGSGPYGEPPYPCKEEEENGKDGSEDSGQSGSEGGGGRAGAHYVFRQEGYETVSYGDNLYVCIPCAKGFPSSEQLNAHVETHTEEELFIKEEGAYETGSAGAEEEAEDLSAPSAAYAAEPRPFKCSVCEKTYKDPATLRQHEKTHWLTRPFPCNICGKMFTQRGTMTRHMRSHLGLKPFACDECGMRFTRQYRLTEHMRVHSGEKPYECQLCGGKFTQQRNLISHLRMHTSPS
ncbi:hypermethylated in cancer 2 protein isoform 2 [Camelus ferus]|nr:hypermethylated in cancer 2 protein isoform 2 [Camelus ferus]